MIVNEHFVVIYGPLVYRNEGYAMLLVEKVKAVPTLHLYAIHREGEKLCIIMEFTFGSPLSQMWPSISEDEKSATIHQLGNIF